MPYDRRTFLLAVAALFAVGGSYETLAQKPGSELAVAVANDRAPEVRAMLAKGADPNMLDENGEPVLIVAARGGSPPSAATSMSRRSCARAAPP